MRTGGYTVQQTLTTEAASVLKQSLTLARRRGHAQVTPLHVAATLLSSRISLLRRACIKSHPDFSTNYQFAPSHHHHHNNNQNHPLQCRALELCFNVALNRLPTIPSPMFHGQPSLANALVAALKRAQAHQRRGCIEQQQHHQTHLLAIKVELEQLVISILDDPSVSRVMREAGFNSTAVKNCLEDCSVSSVDGVFSSPYQQKQHQNRFHHYQNPKDFNFINPNFGFWQTHFLNQSPDQNPLLMSSSHRHQRLREIDLKLVIDVLLRKKTKKKNPVLIVGDSVSFTEGLVEELMAKLEREEIVCLKKTHFVKFQFSPMALKFMRREDVETNIKELRKKVVSLTLNGKDVIIFTGDLKWTITEVNNNNGGTNEISSSYSPLDHLVEEIGKLIVEYNAEELNDDEDSKIRRVWVMGTASFQTYMRCQMRKPSLETLWALHPVSVPSSPNLALSLHARSGHEARNMSNVNATKPFSGYNQSEEEKTIFSVLSCCPECVSSFEREAKALKANQEKLLPTWLQSHDGDYSSHKDELMGLERKWNMYCENLHNKTGQSGLPYGLSNELSRSTSLIDSLSVKPNSIAKFRRQNCCTIEFDLGGNDYEKGVSKDENENVEITLDLGRSLFRSDSGTGTRKKINSLVKALEKSVPRHAMTMPLIAEILMDCVLKKKDNWIMIEGSDAAAKRSIARTVSEHVFRSVESLVHLDLTKTMSSSENLLAYGLENQEKVVFLIEDIDLADSRFLKLLADRFETGSERQAIFILTKDDSYSAKNRDSVLQIGLEITGGRKRKPESDLSVKEGKNFKAGEIDNVLWMKKEMFSRQSSFNSTYLDLNIKAEEDEEESPISSDLTGEEETEISSSEFLNRIQNRYVLNGSSEGGMEKAKIIAAAFREVFPEEGEGVRFSVEEKLMEEIRGGKVENGAFESWVKEVLKKGLKTVKKDRGVIRMVKGGILEGVGGYMGTFLPNRVQVFKFD